MTEDEYEGLHDSTLPQYNRRNYVSPTAPAVYYPVPPGRDPAIAIGILEGRMMDVQKSVDRLSSDIKEALAAAVPRGEWTQRNNSVDSKFESHGREIGQLRTEHAADIAGVRKDITGLRNEVDSRRAPASVIITGVLGGVSLVVSIVNAIVG